jgi:hypothetical protein
MLTKPRACIYSRTAVSPVQLVLKLLHLQEPRNDEVSVIGYKYEILSKYLIICTSEEIYCTMSLPLDRKLLHMAATIIRYVVAQ